MTSAMLNARERIAVSVCQTAAWRQIWEAQRGGESRVSHTIRVLENVWNPLSDGCRLAARIWLPVDAEQRPVPAVLE
jgi:predicted acyl esterase